ncbi:MAG: hypothetical protein U0793_24805 [Gemmataceae bacterium]
MPSRSLTTVLIVIAVGLACGHILSTQLVYEPNLHRKTVEPAKMGRPWPGERPEPMPTFSSNDRSRWATIQALVDDGQYAVGQRNTRTLRATFALNFAAADPLHAVVLAEAGYHLRTRPENQSGIIFQDGWQSVDKVLDPSTQQYYSSKPPFLSTLIAGLYWLLKSLTGWTLKTHAAEVVRTILLLVNVVPFAIYLSVLARIGRRYAATEWSRLVVLSAGAFATMVTPFLLTLNNHTFATFSVLFGLASALRIWEARTEGRPLPCWHFLLAGLFAGFAVVNEMPALAFWGGLFVLFLLWSPGKTLLLYVPPGLLLGAGFFLTNYLAVGQWTPVQASFGSPWYAYEGSHWTPPQPGEIRSGIDWAHQRESRAEYAQHLLIGHHGFFSLTPLWLVALVGLCFLCLRFASGTGQARPGTSAAGLAPPEPATLLPWWLPPLALGLTLIVVAFYLFKSDNYGGWTNGPRWLMWLSPLLLVALYPALDKLSACRWGRGLTYVCLAVSVLSANYRPWNPWRHPWLYDALVWLGWPGY